MIFFVNSPSLFGPVQILEEMKLVLQFMEEVAR
jgi:hypothetical protein